MVFKEPLLISRAQRDLYRNALNASAAHSAFLRYANPPAGGPRVCFSAVHRGGATLEPGPGHEQQDRSAFAEAERKRIKLD